ncbi:MAG TPA: LacI family DNA-binding transcriptional regulator [Paracoccaceae bacterium]|nr:LacI family DNA-binding transcriptional regulator [Paracoccaceae bacterium]
MAGEAEDGARTVTLADVARAAGVGESTASRVLRGHGSFSAKTREIVLAAARDLGYVPNRIAGTLASTGSRLVGIVIPSLSNIVFPDLLRGANNVLVAAGFQPVIAVTDYDLEREESVIESLLSWRPAGIMVAGLEHSERAAARLRGARGRVAELLDTDGEGIDIVVGFSNREAGRAAGRHLASRDFRRIGYVGHDVGRDLRAAKRLAGFREALGEAGLHIADEEIVPAPSSIQAGRDGLARLRERRPELDAVYFSNDDMAIGGYFHCLARGIAVPGGLAIFGHNGLDVARCAPQPLTTILTPRVAVGEMGARLVCADGPPTRVDLGFELIEGATT